MRSAEINNNVYLETGWAIAEDHFRHRGPFPARLIGGKTETQKVKKNCPSCSLDRAGKQMMLEKGLMGISEVSDEKAAFPPSLDKIGNTAGGKQSAGVA